jgi:hypothetical protein
MTAAKKRNFPRGGRRDRIRMRAQRILIVCGGDTEREYFDFARAELSASAVKVVAVGKDPLSVVRYASKLKLDSEQRDEAYSEVWVVTDVDDFKNLAEAQRHAQEAGIRLAISNPCFEVWLIDHMRVCPESCSDTLSCEAKAREFGLVSGNTGRRTSLEKAKHIRPDAIRGKIETAASNAHEHNTEEKRACRNKTPDRTHGYTVWTDADQIIEDMKRRES